MNKLALSDLLTHRLQQVLLAAERGDADACEQRARVLVALADAIEAYIRAKRRLCHEAGALTSFTPASETALITAHPSFLQNPYPAASAHPCAAGAFQQVSRMIGGDS